MECTWLYVILATVLGIAGLSSAEEAEWIWAPGERGITVEVVEFRRTFQVEDLPRGDVQLRLLGDFCGCEIFLNGNLVTRFEPYDPASQISAKRWLRIGENRIVVKAKGVQGPSAVALDLVGESGELIIASGGDWGGAVTVSPMGRLQFGNSGLKAIGALDEYNQWKEAEREGTAQFSPLPDGFELLRLRKAKSDEGSWISMAFDPRGRLIISREKRGLLRFDLSSGEMKVVEDTLLEVRGLLFAHGALYANANNSKGLYRLRDPDADGTYDEVELLMKTEGGVGHGRNDLALGPDGMIYSIHGDSVSLPDGISRRRPQFGKEGHEMGHVIRCDADGNNRELMVTGLRNPYGIAFNPDGEAFTYDADNEGDIGLPLYRPARVNHLVSGANYGWQQGVGKSWPVYYPQSLPTTFDAGRGSPTSIEFGTASNFPPRYRDSLFILDWAYGRIIALDVIPRGASYVCRPQTFLRGRPLNVTDITFGPDGAMYFITGGRGTQSALYRVGYTGEAVAAPGLTVQEVARASFSKDARAIRRGVENFHGRQDDGADGIVGAHSKSPDPWLRHAVLVAIASDPLESNTLVSSLAGIDRSPSVRIPGFASLSRFEKLTSLRIIELAGAENAAENRAFLEPLFPDSDRAVDRELSKLLVALGDRSVVGKSLAKLAVAESQFERLHYLDVLSRAEHGWTPAGRRAFFSTIRHPDYFRGDRNMPGYIKGIRERAVGTLSADQRAALGGLLDRAQQDSPLPEPRALVRHWRVTDLAGTQPEGYRSDPQRGRVVFEQALCSRCHQVGGVGTAVGPNLSAVAARFSRRDLIEAIIEPSRAMAEVFRNLIIRKRDGNTEVGRVVRDDFRESTISISSNPFAPSELTVISKEKITGYGPSPISPMPPGLLDGFSREEIFQLLDFLQGAAG